MVFENSANQSFSKSNRDYLSSELNSLLTFIDDFQGYNLSNQLMLASSVASLISEIQKLEPSGDDLRSFKKLAETYYAQTLDANLRVQVIINPPQRQEDWATLFKDIREASLIFARENSGLIDRENVSQAIHSRIAHLMSTVFVQMELEVNIRLSKETNQEFGLDQKGPQYLDKLDQTVLTRLYFLSVLSLVTKGQKVSIPGQTFQETALKWADLLLFGRNEISKNSGDFQGIQQKLSNTLDSTKLIPILENYKNHLKEGLQNFSIKNESLYSRVPEYNIPAKPLNFWGLSQGVPPQESISHLFEKATRIIANQNPKMQIIFSQKLQEIPEIMFLCEALRDSASTLMANNILLGLNLISEWSAPPPKPLDKFPILDLIWDFDEDIQETYISNLTQLAPMVFADTSDDFFKDGVEMLCRYIQSINR
jgi:hypothetical protein